MVLNTFEALNHLARQGAKQTVAVAAAHDPHALEAVLDAAREGLLDYLLVGDREKILALSDQFGVQVPRERILDEKEDTACAKGAVALVRSGQASLLMKGKLQTATLLREVVNRETGIRGGGLMSHIAFFQIPGYHKLIAITDGGMVLAPTLAEKEGILENVTQLFHHLGYDCPKVAALCPVEVENPKIPATVDAAALAQRNREGLISGCLVAGPISYDLAMSREAAAIKGYQSPITGEADILLVPDMTCGNILGKTLIYSAGALMAGCIAGAQVPIVLTSRGATAQEKHLSLLLACTAGVPRRGTPAGT